jgi:glycerol uptake facilitator protein
LSIIGAETIGTCLLILLGDGVVAAVLLNKSKAQNSGWIVITFGWGFGVMAGVYAIGQFSGAHINPAVTLGLWINGNIDGGDVPKYLIGEFAGAMLGAFLVWAAYYVHWAETEDPGLKLSVFCTGPAIRNTGANVVGEAIGTAVLLFGILAIAANAQTLSKPGDVDLSFVFSRGLQPLLVGVLVFGIGLSLGGPTGYAINPARDLGPRIAHAILPIPGKGTSDWGYAWIPVIGPIVGGVAGAGLYSLIGF